MEDDLIKRLEERASFKDHWGDWELDQEALDHIKKLKAALRLYACSCKSVENCGFLGSTCGKFAREVLEGGPDETPAS